VSWLLTLAMLRFAHRFSLLDVPNERSSHSRPTPRGGGVAIVVSFLASMVIAQALGTVAPNLGWALLGAGVAVASIGFADDRWHLAARWRLLGHFVAAAWILWHLGALPLVPAFGARLELGYVGLAVAACYIVWAINFFNFMDGIDGIASVETIAVAGCGTLVSVLVLPGSAWLPSVLLVAATAGFLCWNAPPARIFMGDAGSGFLGLVIGTLSLWHGYLLPDLFWSWFILQGCFMVDATTTLLRRVARGERASVAHRSHAYQFAARRLSSHAKVSAAFGAVTVVWLFPIACAVALGWIDGLLGTVIGYAPLVLGAYHWRAGARELQTE
jgi:Fuc2NAc and GlcNAc transferase